MISIVSEVVGGAAMSGNISNLTNRWLKSLFSTDIVLLDITLLTRKNTHSLIIKKSKAIQRKILRSDRYSCAFRLETISTKNESQIKDAITERLVKNYTEPAVNVAAERNSIRVHRFEPGLCPTITDVGGYTWPSTPPLKKARVKCARKPNFDAERECKLSVDNDQANWSKPNMDQCKIVSTLPDNIPGLQGIPITTENAEDVAKHILLLTTNAQCLSPKDLGIVVSKTSDIVQIAIIHLTLGKHVIGIINNLLNKTENLFGFSTRILNIMETLGNKLEFHGNQVNIAAATVAMTLVNVNFIQFWGIAFGVMSYIDGFIQQIYMNDTSLRDSVAFIELPSSLQKPLPLTKALDSRIQFHFYGETSLFLDRYQSGQRLNSYVVSSSVKGTDIKNLSDPVKVTLQHLTPKQSDESVTCVFWDFERHRGAGGWNSSGCEVVSSSSRYTTCYCNHLTHFGILLDISRSPIDAANLRILTAITYIGCGVSSLFIGMILLTYLAFEILRRDYPAKILVNLCTSLFMLNIVFLTDSWMASFNIPGLCVTVAAALHYFLLTSFTWMGLEAVHMYFALVKVFNIYVRHYILKFCLIGWGVPALVVITLLAIDVELYGYEPKLEFATRSDMFCWLRDDMAFYVSVVAYFGLAFLVNLSMFIVVLSQIQAVRAKRPSSSAQNWFLHHLKSSASLSILLGLTWGLAFFAWGKAQVPFMYLFAIFNTLQGFFIFAFHCLMKDNVRTQWRIHLCCGRFKLDEYSEWSRTGTNAKLTDRRTGSTTHSNKSSQSTTTSSNGSRKNFIPAQEYGNGLGYSNDCHWAFHFSTDQRATNREMELDYTLPQYSLPPHQSPTALYLNA
uniref:adhesion G-protein coupled receptor G4 n=1 Tax=Pristiophorus japonicus TaxID=55135 RepID=UPI00398F8C82